MEEDNHPGPGTRLLDELNGNMNSSGAPDGPTAGHPKDRSGLEETHGDIRVEVIEQSNTESAKFAMGDGGGDMDIGVDLSLDESGVLEGDLESPEPSVTVESSAAACRYTNKEAESPSERSQERTEAAAAPDQALLPPSLEDGGDHHNADTKKVTFPSDEDIVSGAVEPKDPWRHGESLCVDVDTVLKFGNVTMVEFIAGSVVVPRSLSIHWIGTCPQMMRWKPNNRALLLEPCNHLSIFIIIISCYLIHFYPKRWIIL